MRAYGLAFMNAFYISFQLLWDIGRGEISNIQNILAISSPFQIIHATRHAKSAMLLMVSVSPASTRVTVTPKSEPARSTCTWRAPLMTDGCTCPSTSATQIGLSFPAASTTRKLLCPSRAPPARVPRPNRRHRQPPRIQASGEGYGGWRSRKMTLA